MNQTKAQRNTHVDKAHSLSVNKQCELLSISRSSSYYQKATESSLNLELMRLIDEEFMNHPWIGVGVTIFEFYLILIQNNSRGLSRNIDL